MYAEVMLCVYVYQAEAIRTFMKGKVVVRASAPFVCPHPTHSPAVGHGAVVC